MSTDSTELTFVRCPSCRSLVPAVSTRCRMCGAALDPAAAGADESSAQSGGRVRQRTMSSKADSEVAEATEKLREEHTVEELEVRPDEAEVPFDDPLSAYIEEVDVLEEEMASVDPVYETESEPEPELQTEEPVPTEDESPFAMEAPEPELEPATDAAVEEPPFVTEPDEYEPKVRVEHGARGRKNGGLSFSKDATETSQESQPASEPIPAVEEPPVEEEPVVVAPPTAIEPELKEEPVTPVVAKKEPAPVVQKPVPPVVEEPEVVEDDLEEIIEEEPVAKPVVAKPAQVVKPAAKKKPAAVAQVDGRLFGWLVTYSSPEGEAIELREGRFFVTSSSLKDTDLILEDESVSTPHAMVTVSVDSGLVVQDLMSERGVFVRRRGAGVYEREAEPTEIQNGDWVRFGDVEFLVSLIPYVGEQ